MMAEFVYEAIDQRGKIIRDKIEAENVDSAVSKLHAANMTLKDIHEFRESKARTLKFKLAPLKIPDETMALFSRQLATLLRVGVTLPSALDTLARHMDNARLSTIIYNVIVDVTGGYALSKSLAKYPEAFSEVYVAMIKIGEGAGLLADMIEKMAEYQEKDLATKKHIISALYYPAFVLITSIVGVIAMIIYFVPTFTNMYQQMNMKLPAATKLLIALSQVFQNPPLGLGILAGAAVMSFFIYSYVNTPVGRYHLDQLKLTFPIIGPVLNKVLMARFCRSLAALHGAGLNLINALKIMEGLFGNVVITEIIVDCEEGLREGTYVSERLMGRRFVPRSLVDMMAVGEQTGDLQKLLDKLASMLEMEARFATNAAVTLIEPLVIIFLAFMVGFIMLAIFLPLYGLIMNLGT
jgi:type IV pilus assembly protein PilC